VKTHVKSIYRKLDVNSRKKYADSPQPEAGLSNPLIYLALDFGAALAAAG